MVYAASLPGDRNVRVRQVVAAEYVLNQYEGTTMYLEAKISKEHGTVKYKDKTLWLQQEAYADGAKDTIHYEAIAKDDEGIEYRVIWDVCDNWQDYDEECDHCNWEVYTVHRLGYVE